VEAMPEPGTTSNKLIVQNESTTKKRKVEAHKITDSACDKLKTTGFDGMAARRLIAPIVRFSYCVKLTKRTFGSPRELL
jgi:hypothetical protein